MMKVSPCTPNTCGLADIRFALINYYYVLHLHEDGLYRLTCEPRKIYFLTGIERQEPLCRLE